MRLFTFILALLAMLAAPWARAGDAVTVGAAASLRDVITELVRRYQVESDERVDLVFGSSGQLMAQIKSGAPIDLFISAANRQVQELIDEDLADPQSRQVIATNLLVLISPADSDLSIESFNDLADARIQRLAIGEPKTVPAGQYAMQVLKALKIDEALSERLVFGSNVRQVLDYVQRGEVSAGIVYHTDALLAKDKVKVIAQADPQLHEPIEYPAIIIKASKQPDAARRFLEYLQSDSARAVLEGYGFGAADRHDARQE